MTTYKDIHGTKVEVRTDDPANPVNGQVWYNSGTLKGFKLNPAGSWSTGGNTNQARYVPGGGGSQTAAIHFGGAKTPGPASQALTELYNGTSWTEVNDLNTARERISSAANSQTAALGSGGTVYPGASDQDVTESWNGTSWTEVGDLNTTGTGQFGFGTSTAAINAGGGSPPDMNKCELWNGSAWTEVNNLQQGRKDNESGGAGTSTAGIIAGGNNGSNYDNAEYWNGTAWTEVNDLNTARTGFAVSGGQPAALVMGGSPNTAKTEEWNGTSWSEVNDIPATKRNHGGSKVTGSTSALIFGGYITAQVATTFEWSAPTETTVSFTVS